MCKIMKKATLILSTMFLLSFSVCCQTSQSNDGKIEHLTVETFKQKVLNYKAGQNAWNYLGEKPCIIDFYADWCRPCRMLSPELEKIAEEYKNEIIVYKVNTEEQRELSSLFSITSIPALLFVPMEGEPTMLRGYRDSTMLDQSVREILLKDNK